MTLSAPARKRLALLIPMLGSDKDGEVVASVRQIAKALAADGKDFHDLVKVVSGEPTVIYKTAFRAPPEPPKSDWVEMADFCARFERSLSEREAEFVRDMTVKLRRYGEPTPKQAGWLEGIHERLRRTHGATG